MEVYLYNSTICRLCGEGNENGSFLYLSDVNNQNLSETLNNYLPIKVSDDGLLPRTICPGCTIQVEATVEFINLIIKGQKIIRELLAREKEYKKSVLKTSKEPEVINDNIVYEINTSDGVYHVEHPISLQVEGLERPKRKRGRPPKKPKILEEQEQMALEKEKAADNENKLSTEEPPSGKRRRKAPTRFMEAVQGKELDKIFKDEGVTDGEESEVEVKPVAPEPETPKEPEVIGHSETSGELVVVVKGKGRGRPKGRMRTLVETCLACGMQFSCVGRYMSHVAQHGALQYTCAACGHSAPTRLQLQQHQADTQHDGITAVPLKLLEAKDEQRERDPLSLELLETEDSVGETKQTESDDVPEPAGSEEIDSTTDFITGFVKTEAKSNVETDQKGEEAPTGESEKVAKDDEKCLEVKGPNGKVKLKCNYCDKLFSNKQSKSIHVKAVHRGLREHYCGTCGARFAYPRSLTLHLLAHTRASTSKGFACDLCGKVLNHPSSVVYHKEAEHAGQSYACNKCGKSFKHKQLLQRHQLVHSQLRPYTCKSCNATFKTKANLLNHQLLHSGVKRFTCEICKHKFAHKTSLTLHMRWHSGSKPYACSTCGKRFSQKGNLSEHARIHSGEKPYLCSMCPRAFTTSSQRRLHAARHATRNNKSDRSESVRVVTCQHCPLVFNTNAQLNRHKKQVHKQVSLLSNKQQPLSVVVPGTGQGSVQGTGGQHSEKQVIYVTYDDSAEPENYQIIEPEQEDSMSNGKVVETCELYSGTSLLVQQAELQNQLQDELQHQLHSQLQGQLHTDEINSQLLHTNLLPTQHITVGKGGAPLQLTMQDGTRLAITSADGNSLQVITEDGQTIPVEINEYTDDEDNTEAIHQLNMEKIVDDDAETSVTHYFTIV